MTIYMYVHSYREYVFRIALNMRVTGYVTAIIMLRFHETMHTHVHNNNVDGKIKAQSCMRKNAK